MEVRLCVCMYVSKYVCKYVCMYVRIYTHIHTYCTKQPVAAPFNEVYLKDRAKHDTTAREWVQKYAT